MHANQDAVKINNYNISNINDGTILLYCGHLPLLSQIHSRHSYAQTSMHGPRMFWVPLQ